MAPNNGRSRRFTLYLMRALLLWLCSHVTIPGEPGAWAQAQPELILSSRLRYTCYIAPSKMKVCDDRYPPDAMQKHGSWCAGSRCSSDGAPLDL